MYVQTIVDSFCRRFLDLLVSNIPKKFSLKYDPSDGEVRITMLKQWLERIIINFWIDSG